MAGSRRSRRQALRSPERAGFRKKFPAVSNCATPNDEAKPWAYRDADLKVAKAYSSVPPVGGGRTGFESVPLRRADRRCRSRASGLPYRPAEMSTTSARGCGWWTPETTTTTAKSELVFAIDRYDEGGLYELFYDDFKGARGFQFSYH